MNPPRTLSSLSSSSFICHIDTPRPSSFNHLHSYLQFPQEQLLNESNLINISNHTKQKHHLLSTFNEDDDEEKDQKENEEGIEENNIKNQQYNHQKEYISKFHGVSWYQPEEKWISQISIDEKPIFLGYFDKEEDAAKIFDEMAFKLGDRNELINFNCDKNNKNSFIIPSNHHSCSSTSNDEFLKEGLIHQRNVERCFHICNDIVNSSPLQLPPLNSLAVTTATAARTKTLPSLLPTLIPSTPFSSPSSSPPSSPSSSLSSLSCSSIQCNDVGVEDSNNKDVTKVNDNVHENDNKYLSLSNNMNIDLLKGKEMDEPSSTSSSSSSSPTSSSSSSSTSSSMSLSLNSSLQSDMQRNVTHPVRTVKKTSLKIKSKSQQFRPNKGPSRYVGVRWHRANQKWTSYIRIGGRQMALGAFVCEKEAALKYDQFAARHGRPLKYSHIYTRHVSTCISRSRYKYHPQYMNFASSTHILFYERILIVISILFVCFTPLHLLSFSLFYLTCSYK